MKDEMQQLIVILEKYQDRKDLCWDSYPYVFKMDENEYSTEDYKALSEAEGLADDLFITDNGHVNHDNVHKMRDLGFDVFPMEADSYGWLVGGVRKNGTNGPTLSFG